MNDMRRQIRKRSAKTRRRSSTAGLLCIPLLLFFYAQLFPMGASSHVTLSPQSYLESQFPHVELCLETGEFILFFVKSGQEGVPGQPYAFVRRIGMWVQDAPYKRNRVGVSFGREAAYYYGRFSDVWQAVGKDGTIYTPVQCGEGAVYSFPVPGVRDVYDFGQGKTLILQAKTRASEHGG